MPKTTHIRIRKEDHEKLKDVSERWGTDMSEMVSDMVEAAYELSHGEYQEPPEPVHVMSGPSSLDDVYMVTSDKLLKIRNSE
jgi:hypothetical protein